MPVLLFVRQSESPSWEWGVGYNARMDEKTVGKADFDVDEAFKEFQKKMDDIKSRATMLERDLLKAAEEEKLRRIRSALSAL